MTKVFLWTMALTAARPDFAQQPDIDHVVFQMGNVYYFGYEGVDLVKLREQMPLHSGDNFSFTTFDDDKIEAAVKPVTGKPPTDVSVVCCDETKHVTLSIGVAGTTYWALPTAAAPTGADHLSPEAMDLYDH